MTVSELLRQPRETILSEIGGIYEHSPWVVEQFLDDNAKKELSSIETVSDLAGRLKRIVNDAPENLKTDLLKSHPDLCAKVEQMRTLTAESQDEQSRSGLQSLSDNELVEFRAMNDAYKARYGFPFILAVRNARKSTVLSALDGRLKNSNPERERATALEQVHNIAWMRLLSKIDYSKTSKGFLTCHVLDTANGTPADGMKIVLKKLSGNDEGAEATVIGEFVTNDDGRLSNGPALKNENFLVGTYEWTFYVGDYFASKGAAMNGTPFLDVVPLRFGIDNPDDHYHVPLLVSPWSYSTYRGS